MRSAFTFLLAVSAVVPSASTAAPPAAASDKGALQFLLGSWRVVAVDPANGDRELLCYVVSRFVGDRWLSGHGTSEANAFESRDVWGQDLETGEIMRSIYDASGTYAVVRSSGWQGDKLVLEGDARSSGGALRVRETIQKTGPNAFTATWEAYRDGRWLAYSLETAERQAAGKCRSARSG